MKAFASLFCRLFARRGLFFAAFILFLLFAILAALAYGMAHAGPNSLTSSLRASIPAVLSGEKVSLKSLTKQIKEVGEDKTKDPSPTEKGDSQAGPQVAREPGEGQSWLVTGLELDAPQRLTRPDVVFVTAKVKAAPASKVELVWHVEGVWEHPGVKTRYEIRDDRDKDGSILKGRRVQIVIPDVSGIVRVFAVAIVDGKPTYKGLAMTLIEMNYAPLHRPGDNKSDNATPPLPGTSGPATPARQSSHQAPAAQAPESALATANANKPKLLVYFIIDSVKGDVNLNDMLTSVGLRNRIRALGMVPKVFDKDSEDVVRNGLSPYLPKEGVPAMVIASPSPERKVYKSIACPKTIQGILDELK